MIKADADVRRFAWLALAYLSLTGMAGVVLRFVLIGVALPGTSYINLRHAHSHVAYFGWATLGLMAAVYCLLPELTGRPLPRPRLVRWQMAATAAFTLVAFLAFARSGYEPVRLGGARIPVSVAFASANTLTWYVFAWLFRKAARGGRRPLSLDFLTVAVGFMLIASLGTWGRAALMASGSHDPVWDQATVYLFLELFADGWFSLALFGLLYHLVPRWTGRPIRSRRVAEWQLGVSMLCLAPTFLLAMPTLLVPAPVRAVAGVCGLAVAAATLAGAANLALTWGRRALLASPAGWLGASALAMLSLKALAQALWALEPVAARAQNTQLTVFYLHLSLLGWVSLALAAVLAGLLAARPVRLRLASGLLLGGVAAMLLSLAGAGLAGLGLATAGVDGATFLRAAAWSSVPAAAGMSGIAWSLRAAAAGRAPGEFREDAEIAKKEPLLV